MKNKKWVLISLLLIFIVGYSIVSILTDKFYESDMLNYSLLIIVFVITIYLIKEIIYAFNVSIGNNDKFYKTLIKNSSVLYIIADYDTKNVIYMSDNVDDVLGISNYKNKEEILYKILNIPVIKNELNSWDKVSSYVSGIIEYDNPKYNYQSWIRIRVYPYKDKKHEYYIIQVMDATKDHDRQHLLISQATDIKARENVLNQITSKSYDFEININLNKDSYELKYFKKDNLYFGEEKRGVYSENLESFLSYINDSDRDIVYSNLNMDALKQHFLKYELDSISIRYRVGNEVKNNTWLESTIFFVSDRQKNIVSILTKNVTEDATSIREQNVLLQNALNESKKISKSKTELISTISHDIRTPLTNIIGLSDSLLDGKLDDSIKEDIKNINDSSNDMLKIIDGLLDTSKIEKKLLEKSEKNYSILKMFKKVETSAKEYLGDKQIKLNINLDSNLPVILYGDYIRITKAINEIVSNSIKYTDEGEININVRGEKKKDNFKIIVEVNDTGIGIEENKLKDIMSSNSSDGIGSVKKLVELLDGTLEIESEKNKYTRVTLSFVQKIVEDNKVREMLDNNKKAEKFSLKGKKVLVVDDNTLNLKVTSKLLSSYDVEVILLESGEECVDYISENNSVDLILMDQMMPGMSGSDTMLKLKSIDGFSTPIVVLTADAMEGQKDKYLDMGFDDYISKPIDKLELSKILKEFLKK